jgi:LVIVD repeat-containing protein
MTTHRVARDITGIRSTSHSARLLALAAYAASATACAHSGMPANSGASPAADMSVNAPSPDPRVGLKAGLWDAGQAQWNLRLLSNSRPTGKFLGETNSDLAFSGPYAIEGSYNGFQVWDISNPSAPTLKTAEYCPASQSDVSVYKTLLFVSGEGTSGRIDCGDQGVKDTVSAARLRGIRIFDISDLAHPKNVANVQTCRGSHTHTLVVDPNDHDNVYIYVSGSAGVRSPSELPGCVSARPEQDPNSSLFRIEIIKVPLAHPEQAAIVSSAHLFTGLGTPQSHGEAAADREAAAAERAKGKFTATIFGDETVLPEEFIKPELEQIVKARGGTGAATSADSATLRQAVQGIVNKMVASQCPGCSDKGFTPTQCHDITVYPSIGLAGGACEGYGMLIDIKDPAHPVRLDAVSDSNFSYWHSATFNNDGTKLLFSDEWGGGGQPKCRATDPHNWGADAIFTIQGQKLVFQSYYKMLAPQTPYENCVAHNGSLIPIPGRDIMVQAWYQGGISVFDWTDAAHPKEIAFFDRGPVDSTRLADGGEWSAYWYNGVIVGSEIARGLDVWELLPSGLISKNEIDAAKSVHLPELNVQGQPKYVWPPSFALARAYADQLERSQGLSADRITAIRQALDAAEKASGSQRHDALTQLATQVDGDAGGAGDGAKVRKLADAVRQLSSAPMASAGTAKTAAGD